MATTAPTVSVISNPPVTDIQEKPRAVPSPDWVVFLVFAGDFVVVTAAFVWAIIKREYFDFGLLTQGFVAADYFRSVFLATVVYIVLLNMFGGYQKHMILHKFQTIRTVFKTSVVWTAIFLGSTLLLE